MHRRIVMLTAAIAVTLAVAPAAGTAQAAAKPNQDLSGVSCLSANDCIAVGSDQTRDLPLAQTWNGTKWASSPARLPAGATTGGLTMVSCAAAKSCVAIGEYSRGSEILAESWNGRTWTAGKLPPPAGLQININALSCPAVNDCLAAGYYAKTGGYMTYPLADWWNGRKWTPVQLPHPAKSIFVYLYGVSCATARSCVAVGEADLSTGTGGAFADTWNGRTWSDSMLPAPRGSFTDALSGVSCASATSCVAVGRYSPRSGTTQLAEFWNGRTWRAASVPGPPTGLLGLISCMPKTASCLAVGDDASSTYSSVWNGSSWKNFTIPAPRTDPSISVYGLSCPSAAGCVAVGIAAPSNASSTFSAYSWVWNGKSWRAVATL
jgi:hypothetical protein